MKKRFALSKTLASFFLMLSLLATAAASPTVYTVTNTSGDADTAGSLPWALFQAEWFNSQDARIEFDIPGSGPHTISVNGPLALKVNGQPNRGVVVDATTQPGYAAGQPVIMIDFNGIDAGFNVVGRGSGLRGLCINNFRVVGVAILSGSGHRIQNCWIGFQPNGSGGYLRNFDLGNDYSIGIGIEGSYHQVTGNTIAGVYNGITMGRDPVMEPATGSQYFIAYYNYIANNRLGMAPDGVTILRNLEEGIFLGNGATWNHIAYNIISGNDSAGVEILGVSGWENYVYGNLIGASATGGDAGNGDLGVLIANGSQRNYIGNWVGNYIYYNRLNGIGFGLDDQFAAPGTVGPTHNNQASYNVIFANNTPGQSLGTGISITNNSWYNVVLGNNIYGHAVHGVILNRAVHTWVTGNYVGWNAANQGYGVITMNSYGSYIYDNSYGSNGLGNVGVIQSYGGDWITDR